LLATSIDGADLLLCALVTLLTLADGPTSFDVSRPPSRPELITVFLRSLLRLCVEKKSLELIQTLELFSDRSITLSLVKFYRAIELFTFRRSEETILPELNKLIKEKDEVTDDLIGNVAANVVVSECLFPMIDALV
jgi:hypothetical protein